MAKKAQKVEFKDLPFSQKANLATKMGDDVGKLVEIALKKANKLLNKHGFGLDLEIKFYELDNKNNELKAVVAQKHENKSEQI